MIIINLVGLFVIAFIIWWFWLYTPTKAVDSTVENITVLVHDGIYQPSRIKVPAGKQITVQFFRQDASPCAATVIFPAFELSEELALNAKTSIALPPMSSGEYAFHCPMKMYSGTLIVD